MSAIKDTYYDISDLDFKGFSPASIALQLDLPIELVLQVVADIQEFDECEA